MFLKEVVSLQLSVSHSNIAETSMKRQPEISHGFQKLFDVK